MRLRLVALLAALWAGCATTPAPSTPPAPPPRPPLSPPAAAFFARAEAPSPGGALVVDLDALETLGLVGQTVSMDQLAGIATSVMAQLSAGDDEAARYLARGAVAGALLRQWAKWPGVRRFGVLVPTDRVLKSGPDVLPNEAVAALAVEESATDSAQLLAGLAGVVRAVAEEVSREGAEVRLALHGQDLCVEGAEVNPPVCIRPRPGLLLMGTPTALTAFEALPPVAPAAPGAEGPLLVGLRVDLGARGRGRLAFTGRDAVRLTVKVEGAAPKDVGMIDAVAKQGLTEYDAHQAKVRERVAAGLAEVQRALAQDPQAPVTLKAAASTLTTDAVVDEKGYWAQTRQSVQMASTQDSFSLTLTVPAGAVKDLGDQVSKGGAMVPVMGILAAIAIPNFIKFDARAKQSEVKTILKSAFVSQRVYFAGKDKYGRTFEEIGFAPEPGRRYTYCLGKQCLPCDRKECKVSPPPSPCQGLTSVGTSGRDGFSICAYGNLDSDADWDVWVIDQDGEPQNLNNDLE